MSYLNSIEKMFHDDIRQKKITGSGIHSRTGKRGYVGKMMFPTDFMTRKEKYNYRKAGKIVTTNLYDEITLTWQELILRPEDQIKKYFLEWRKRFSNKEIAGRLGLKEARLYYYYNKYGVIDKTVSEQKKEARIGKGKGKLQSEEVSVEEAKQPQKYEPTPEPVLLPKLEGMHFSFTGTHKSEKIIAKLEKIMLLLTDEENDFDIQIFIQEMQPTEEEIKKTTEQIAGPQPRFFNNVKEGV
ncbi:MAG TPA: hypothetical protein VK190_11325 [Pseudoneobacillus sp.]|nr:hypothetical protein [Pseudoneobacillus sp.]